MRVAFLLRQLLAAVVVVAVCVVAALGAQLAERDRMRLSQHCGSF